MLSREFIFGVATSSHQVEGAAGARLPSIWDTFSKRSDAIRDGSIAGVACDHVNKWQEDVDLIATLGVDAYRLSMAWGRVLNSDGSVNSTGMDFYVRLLDRLNEKEIKPFVTLYHWDLPQYIEDNGGWPNRDTAYRFRDYADVITRALGDRVYSYATLNEPFCSAYLGYEIGIHAPGQKDRGLGRKAGHNLLLAHGLGMQVLEANSPASQNGIVLNFTPSYAASTSEEDLAATDAADVIHNQWYARPVLAGAYPAQIDDLPAEEKPDIHDGDMELISTPIDFLGVNYYTRAFYRASVDGEYEHVQATSAPVTTLNWEIFPQGLTDLLCDLDEQYSLPPVYIAENGAAMPDVIHNGEIHDEGRLDYLQGHIEAVNSAIEKGVNVAGYFVWSLMDNFEWAEGYEQRFGLVYVDFDTQQRTIKDSGHALTRLLQQRAQRHTKAG